MAVTRIKFNRLQVSGLIYVLLNISLPLMLLIVLFTTKSLPLGMGLIILSKWRVLAVRPRYWLKNIRSNLVDLIVGLSIAVLIYQSAGSLVLQILLTVLFAVWLLILKPKSSNRAVIAQSGIAVFFGTTTLFMVSYSWPSIIVVVAMWLIGYTTCRHVLSHYHEPNRSFYALAWGLIIAEIAWIGYHWQFSYVFLGLDSIKIPQIAIVVTALSFLTERVYLSYKKNDGRVLKNDIIIPAVFSISLIILVLVIFNPRDLL